MMKKRQETDRKHDKHTILCEKGNLHLFEIYCSNNPYQVHVASAGFRPQTLVFPYDKYVCYCNTF